MKFTDGMYVAACSLPIIVDKRYPNNRFKSLNTCNQYIFNKCGIKFYQLWHAQNVSSNYTHRLHPHKQKVVMC